MIICISPGSYVRFKNAVEKESMKYSVKAPVPTKWQPRVTRNVKNCKRSESFYVSNITSTSQLLLEESINITELLRRKILINITHDYQNFKYFYIKNKTK